MKPSSSSSFQDPSASVATSGHGTSTGQDGQMKPSSAVQQNHAQTIQPVASSPSGVVSVFPRRFHWSHALIAIGFLTASGAGTVVIFKKTIIPRFKSWICSVVSNEHYDDPKRNVIKPSLKEVVTATKAAAAAAADVARTSQEMVIEQSIGKQYNTGRSIHVEEGFQGRSLSRSKPLSNGGAEFDSHSDSAHGPGRGETT